MLRLLRFAVAAILLSHVTLVVRAAAFTTHQIHEKRDFAPDEWERGMRLDEGFRLPIRIGLKQSNMDKLHDMLMDVSLPESPNYGKHWTLEKVRETFGPSQESRDTVISWLEEAGIHSSRLDHPRIAGGWIAFNATVKEAEALFQTQYYAWTHPRLGKRGSLVPAVGNSYSLPAHVRAHVDFVTPTLHFDAKLKRHGKIEKVLVTRDVEETSQLDKRQHNGMTNMLNSTFSSGVNGSTVAAIQAIGTEVTPASLAKCGSYITPNCLRALYNIPILATNTKTNAGNSIGIVEYTPQQYIPSDLLQFWGNYSTQQVQKMPTMISSDGGSINFVPPDGDYLDLSAESNLDLEYSMSLVNPIKTTLYQTGDQEESASFGDFLDVLDASYCAGDDPRYDAQYPDPYSDPGYTSYKGPKQCGGYAPAKVISTSYGYNEHDLTPAYEIRQCNEYAKLGLLGTTFTFSSGDNGVAGNYNKCISPTTGRYNTGTSGQFTPSFPGGCPYVLSIGATQIPAGGSVSSAEIASNTVIYSGGGFSNVFGMPSYQTSALQTYYANYLPTYSSTQYNTSQTSRGFPDVSANGANYIVIITGQKYRIFGTSCSSPVFASVLTLINEARLNAGKSTLGFVNPAMYANPSMFNDIVSGNNPGCGTNGFSAVPGWDPVTGLGTPNYTKMLQYFMSH